MTGVQTCALSDLSMAELMQDSQGMNLRFPTLDLEAKRTDYAGKKTARGGRKA